MFPVHKVRAMIVNPVFIAPAVGRSDGGIEQYSLAIGSIIDAVEMGDTLAPDARSRSHRPVPVP
jgi:hypothetical protein